MANSTISIPRVLCGLSPPLLGHTPAPSCDNRGSVWLGLGARDLSGSSPCSSTAPSLFLALDKTTRIHNKPSGHQVSVCHDCLGPCQRGYKPAVLKLHVCWPDASVVADPERGRRGEATTKQTSSSTEECRGPPLEVSGLRGLRPRNEAPASNRDQGGLRRATPDGTRGTTGSL